MCKGMVRTSLTNKQMWRRQQVTMSPRDPKNIANLIEEDYEEENRLPTKSDSNKSFDGDCSWDTSSTCSDSSSSIIVEETKPLYVVQLPIVKPKKSVSFHHLVKCVLIPTKEEYYAAHLDSELWWNDSDFAEFKASTVHDAKKYMYQHGILDLNLAIREMCKLNHQEVKCSEKAMLEDYCIIPKDSLHSSPQSNSPIQRENSSISDASPRSITDLSEESLESRFLKFQIANQNSSKQNIQNQPIPAEA